MSWEVLTMRSRISFFNKTVFRKNLTRFAPAWLIYTAGCLLVILNVISTYNRDMSGELLGESLGLMAFANFCYAPVCALLLFGDLFNSRLCNALHAMPLRRETWFFTHLLSGLCFCLIPYTLVALCTLPVLSWNWVIAPIWLLGSVLEFSFFFSVSVLCVFCTGSRFAAAVFYFLMNFLAYIAAWFVAVIYGPLLTGVTVEIGWASVLTPVVFLADHYDWMCWFDKQDRAAYGIGECWTYLLVISVLAVAVYGISLALYKRRKLECAGDFVAVKAIAPAFQLVYTLAAGVIFHLFSSIFVGDDTVGAFFAVGLVIGWFTGLMLLQRTVRVFRGKTLLGLVILAAALLVSFLLTWADPLGITRWVPGTQDVKAVQLDGYGFYNSAVEITDPVEIADITDIHSQAIEEHIDVDDPYTPVDQSYVTMILRYKLESGKTVERSYNLGVSTDLAQRLVPYFSDPKVIFSYDNWEDFLDELYQIRVDWDDDKKFTGEDAVSLAEAIRADCEAGNMVQFWEFHEDSNGAARIVDVIAGDRHFEFTIYYDCENTINWLRERGILEEIIG